MTRWHDVRLADHCEIVSGATPRRDHPEYWGGDIAWVTPKDLRGLDGPVLEDTPEKITKAGYKSCSTRLLPMGSVLFSSRAPIGLVAITGREMCTNQGFKSLIPGADVDAGYLYWCLKRQAPLIAARSSGTTFSEISRKGMERIKIPLPPLPEQREIAAILDKAHAIRRKRQQTLDLADQFLRSAFLDMFGDPVTNPMGWERRTLGEMINFVGGSQPPKETFTYEPSEETVRLVQIRDFKSDRYKTYIPKALARRPFNKDDVMIARYGPPVFQILTGLSGSYNVALMKAEPIGLLEKRFVFHLLSHPSVNAAVVAQSERTAGQSGVNLQFLNNYPAYLPPPGEQHRFAAIDNSVGQQTARQRAHLAGLETLSASLQSRAFRGEL
jgi:type I restriction enzyme S subunit